MTDFQIRAVLALVAAAVLALVLVACSHFALEVKDGPLTVDVEVDGHGQPAASFPPANDGGGATIDGGTPPLEQLR